VAGRSVIYSIGVSLDGFIAGPDDWETADADPAAGEIEVELAAQRRMDLELLETRTIGSRVVYLRYRRA
jgi:hypothetical protein